jgi:hypothetical protein
VQVETRKIEPTQKRVRQIAAANRETGDHDAGERRILGLAA